MAVRFVGSTATSLQFVFITCSKWTVAFRLPGLNEVLGPELPFMSHYPSLEREG